MSEMFDVVDVSQDRNLDAATTSEFATSKSHIYVANKTKVEISKPRSWIFCRRPPRLLALVRDYHEVATAVWYSHMDTVSKEEYRVLINGAEANHQFDG